MTVLVLRPQSKAKLWESHSITSLAYYFITTPLATFAIILLPLCSLRKSHGFTQLLKTAVMWQHGASDGEGRENPLASRTHAACSRPIVPGVHRGAEHPQLLLTSKGSCGFFVLLEMVPLYRTGGKLCCRNQASPEHRGTHCLQYILPVLHSATPGSYASFIVYRQELLRHQLSAAKPC